MPQKDISEQIKNLYDVEISDGLVSKIVDKITPDVTTWQNRPLESVYPFVFMDAIHYKFKENHQYITKAANIVLGIQKNGKKNILEVWIGKNESVKFWLNVMNDLKSRGVKAVMSDLKKVYQEISEDEALNNLMQFKEKWNKNYSSCVRSWE